MAQNINNVDNSDLRQFVLLITKNYKLFVVCVIIALVVGFLANSYMVPKYKIASSMLIKEENNKAGGNVTDFLNSSLFGANKNFQNELWVLKSAPVIKQTISNLDLTTVYCQKRGLQYFEVYGKVPFRVLRLQNHIQPVNVRFQISILDNEYFRIKTKGRDVSFVDINSSELAYRKEKWEFEYYGKFGKLIETDDLSFVVELDAFAENSTDQTDNYYFSFTDTQTLAEGLRGQLTFRVVDKMATVIEIVYKSPSVAKGKDIVNELMNVYSQQNLERKNHSAGITINYIEQQLNEISDSLSYTEDKLQRFRSSNQLLNVSEQATGITVQYMDLQNRLAELEANKRYYDYVDDYLSKNEDISNMIVPASMGIPDQMLNNLMSELMSAQAQRSNLIQNNQELNPLVQKLTIQIENIKKTISENISALRKTTDISVDEMNKRIRKVEAAISRLPATQRQLGGIERSYRLNDAIYNYLLEKRAEAKITLASNIPDNIIIEPAKMVGTDPVSPNVQLNFLIALFLGLALPFGFVIFKSATNDKIETQETIERLTPAPVLGKIAHNHRRHVSLVFDYPNSTLAESFRTLRTNIEYQFRNESRKVILVTSCLAGEGKSFTSLNLAMSYALLGRRTLLVDYDLRKAGAYFKDHEEIKVGLCDWYSNGTSSKSIIGHSPYKNLDYIKSGMIPSNPTELLALDKTQLLFDHLKTVYDCIILDTSPLALVSDTYQLMDYADIKIVIVRYNFSIKNVFAMIMKDLKQKGIPNVGIVMNDNRVYGEQYGYGYGYNHQKSPLDTIKRKGSQYMKAVLGKHIK
ncbi:GumC family protein [Gaoshiqia sediminis]|uniref:non-specific protein-tyrosine kinase n=1 Tax=Gaoshiqia sediminis TaxID=2986998 RepID=A0AA41Y5T0_9BACT|nr:tyrosine-protein kinase [Gaoshiqia sediminis]MCW0481657.1 polysaccharide biosynthesis tyrosine autokinase [Gaoshiqia sediminis]